MSPIAFSIGSFQISWYGVCFLLGALGASGILHVALTVRGRGEFSWRDTIDLALTLVFGALVGARIGYILIYYPSYYWAHPLAVISPFDTETGVWVGVAGMSYHGGVIGVAVALLVFAKMRRLSFWKLADATAFAAPVASSFGRIGNYVVGELPGRLTRTSVEGQMMRYPSALFEALVEGVMLFCILLILSRHTKTPGILAAVYLLLYGCFRFVLEFFREPDPQIGFLFGGLTLGQYLSLAMIALGGILFAVRRYVQGDADTLSND